LYKGGLAIVRVCLLVSVLDKDDETVKGYASYIEVPFVPTVGMKFKRNSSTWLWETKNGELDPEVKEVVYNIDEETVYCLFEIYDELKASFWKEIKNISNNYEFSQFITNY
jgi:hypothetical protein